MSTIKFQGNVNGTGSITFASPNTNSNQTLNLPDTTGILVTNNMLGNMQTSEAKTGSYTCNLADAGKWFTWDGNGTFTLPASASPGTVIGVYKYGSNSGSFAPAGADAINTGVQYFGGVPWSVGTLTGFVWFVKEAGAIWDAALGSLPPRQIIRGTAVNSTSGSAIDFTGIPPWVRRVTVMFQAVSMTGTNWLTMQLGTSGGIQNTGYVGGATVGVTSGIATDRFVLNSTSQAPDTRSGIATLCNLSGNVWAFSGVTSWVNGAVAGSSTGSGVVNLSSTLDRVRVLSYGADTFDAGSINIMYE